MVTRPELNRSLAWSLVLALGIDTSTPMVSVALVRDDEVLARRDELVHNAHGEVLAVLVADALREAGVAAADLDVLGVGLGPGPFTGLRAGIVTAAAMSDALEIPSYGMCSLDAIARPFAADGTPFAVVTDARRRQVYWAIYSPAGDRIEGPEISTPADLAEHLRGRVGVVTGTAAPDHVEVFEGCRLSDRRWPDSAVIAIDAMSRTRESPQPLTPLYLRRPDARPPGAPKKVTPA